MATIKTPSYYKEPSGRMDDAVFYCYRGKIYMRPYVIPANPDTPSQRAVRRTFGNAVRAWQILPIEKKEKYNKKSRRLNLSGYNLFISNYMKEYLLYRDIKVSNSSVKASFIDTSPVSSLSEPSVPPAFLFAMDSVLLDKGTFHSPGIG